MKSAARAAKLADDAARKRAERAAKAQKNEAEKKRKREARKKTKKGTQGGEVRWARGNDLLPAYRVSCVTGKPLPPPRDASPVTVVRAPAKYLARRKRELAAKKAAKKAADYRREREAALQQKGKRGVGPDPPQWHLEFVKTRMDYSYYSRSGRNVPMLRYCHDWEVSSSDGDY